MAKETRPVKFLSASSCSSSCVLTTAPCRAATDLDCLREPVYDHLTALPLARPGEFAKVLRWPLLSNEFGIRREHPLQVASNISPVSEWNLIETTNQKLQSANPDPIRHRQVALLESHA